MGNKLEPFKKRIITESEYNVIKAMLRGGAKQKEVAAALNRSITSVSSIARSETYQDFRKVVIETWKRRKAKDRQQREKAEQLTIPVERDPKTNDMLKAIFEETINVLADLAAKEEEAVTVHVNMRDRIYIAETRLRRIFNGEDNK